MAGMQCKAKNWGDTPYTLCLDEAGHEGNHWDAYGNYWMQGRDRPWFPRVRRALRMFVEADVTGRSDEEVAEIREALEGDIASTLAFYRVEHVTERRRVREPAPKHDPQDA